MFKFLKNKLKKFEDKLEAELEEELQKEEKKEERKKPIEERKGEEGSDQVEFFNLPDNKDPQPDIKVIKINEEIYSTLDGSISLG